MQLAWLVSVGYRAEVVLFLAPPLDRKAVKHQSDLVDGD
jgi:hypothetical protein